MRITPEIIRQEFIGAEMKVAKSPNPSCRGLAGKVMNETRNTFTLLNIDQEKIIEKKSNVFHFKFLDGTIVQIDGNLLIGRPEDRLKKNIRRLW